MLKNYFHVAWRNFRNSKVFSFINITGLAFGITCGLLILLWVRDERSINDGQVNGDRLYILYERQYVDNKINAGYYTPGLLAIELKKNVPEIENAVGYRHSFKSTFETKDKILEQDGAWTDRDYFKMFSYPLLIGNPETALNSPLSIAISNKMAIAFFGSATEAMGKTIKYKNRKDFKISAVFADLPSNVWQKFDFLLNWTAFVADNEWLKDWRNNGPQTYIMLRRDANPLLVKKKLNRFLDAYNKSQTKSFRIELDMQRFGETYLHSNFVNGQFEGGRIQYVWLFSLIALFIILIACINFMNLTTARSVKRSKEIGVRKVSGAIRGLLILQFLGEAVLVTSMSMLLSIFLTGIFLPLFNQLTGKQIIIPLTNVGYWLFLAGFTLVIGLVSGSYPALFLSSFNPVQVLKGPMKFNRNNIFFRKGLVVFQFVLSIILIISTIYISKQVSYVEHLNLGYDRENLLYIPMEGDLSEHYNLFKQEGLNTNAIRSISRVSDEPTSIDNATASVVWDGKDPNTSPMFTTISAGYDFVKTMNLQLLEGRDFSKDYAGDSSAYLVNEEALKLINYKNPLGRNLALWDQKGVIVGILKDFHFTSLHDPIKPLIVHAGETDNGRTILVRTKPGQTKEAVNELEKICKTLNPQFPFTFSFSDEEYQKLYRSEEIVSRLSNYFAVLAIFISCIGLLGLAMFTADQRTKEIGIRKVLGASVLSLFALLSGEFIMLVVFAMFIAVPIAWWAMNNWANNFAYRTPMEWWVFIFAGAITLVITLLTVSFQAMKAAFTKPVTSLRTE